MINWALVVFNACWILGLAILLAVFSYHRWQNTQANNSETSRLSPAYQAVAYILIGIGLVGTSDRLFERILWVVLTILMLIDLYRNSPLLKRLRRS